MLLKFLKFNLFFLILDSTIPPIESLLELAAIGFFYDKNKILNIDSNYYNTIDVDEFVKEIIIVFNCIIFYTCISYLFDLVIF